MICPKCKQVETQVLDSRDAPDSIRRRRECLGCKYRFTTYERLETPSLCVTKKNGDTERFEPEKIYRGIRIACKNRPITSAQLDSVVDEIVQQVYFLGKDSVSSHEIGLLVQKALQDLDQIAYLRFTSVYQSFADLQQFEQEIHNFI